MAKNFYSYEKRQQELKKQKKRADKLKKKQEKKQAKEDGTYVETSNYLEPDAAVDSDNTEEDLD